MEAKAMEVRGPQNSMAQVRDRLEVGLAVCFQSFHWGLPLRPSVTKVLLHQTWLHRHAVTDHFTFHLPLTLVNGKIVPADVLCSVCAPSAEESPCCSLVSVLAD